MTRQYRVEELPGSSQYYRAINNRPVRCMATKDIKSDDCRGIAFVFVWRVGYEGSLCLCKPCLELLELDYLTRPGDTYENEREALQNHQEAQEKA